MSEFYVITVVYALLCVVLLYRASYVANKHGLYSMSVRRVWLFLSVFSAFVPGMNIVVSSSIILRWVDVCEHIGKRPWIVRKLSGFSEWMMSPSNLGRSVDSK